MKQDFLNKVQKEKEVYLKEYSGEKAKIVEYFADFFTISLFGEEQKVSIDEIDIKNTLQLWKEKSHPKEKKFEIAESYDKITVEIRKYYEAINLGVLSQDNQTLLDFTVGIDKIKANYKDYTKKIEEEGLAKTVFGYYGAGKTHFLSVIKQLALQDGYVVSYVEFDPKEADPAKPHTVYRNIINSLNFPIESDGNYITTFYDFINEVVNNYNNLELKSNNTVIRSNSFSIGLSILSRLKRGYNTNKNDFEVVVNWLGGDYKAKVKVDKIKKSCMIQDKLLSFPQTKESSDIYVYNIVVLSELIKKMGYKGLVLIFDEAEHVKGYNVRRKEKANNFFDILARCAYPRLTGYNSAPLKNDHNYYDCGEYWNKGPFYSLYVGLTPMDNKYKKNEEHIKDYCVFCHNEEDMIFIENPESDDFCKWVQKVLTAFFEIYPNEIISESVTKTISQILKQEYSTNTKKDFRFWAKQIGFIISLALTGTLKNSDELINAINEISESEKSLPWE